MTDTHHIPVVALRLQLQKIQEVLEARLGVNHHITLQQVSALRASIALISEAAVKLDFD